MNQAVNIIWYRNDLRTYDHSGLTQAYKTQLPTIAVFYICNKQWDSHFLSQRKRSLIKHRLIDLEKELSELNIPLFIFKTPTYKDSINHLINFCSEFNAKNIYLNNDYELDEIKRDQHLKNVINKQILIHEFNDNIFFHPELIKTQQNTPFKVFTPFKNKVLQELQFIGNCHKKPKVFAKCDNIKVKGSVNLELQKELESNDNYSKTTNHSQKTYISKLRKFVQENAEQYHETRDIPSLRGTSELSFALSVGILSVKQLYFRLLKEHQNDITQKDSGANTWLNELIWREFYRHTTYHFPDICKGYALKENYQNIPFNKNPKTFKAWCEGNTGFPIVDSAMRCLNQTGWMHNRLRMITASFLVKDLQIDWRLGEQYFMQQLNDADFASNNGGWQWCASSGFDSAPYFRIFNPTTQAQRFDPEGKFVKKWLPELKSVPAKYIHEPHKFNSNISYPLPIVDHKQARLLTLDLYKQAIG